MGAKLNAVQPVGGYIGRDLLVRNSLVLLQDLQIKGRKEIFIAVPDHEQRSAQRTVSVGIDIEETVGSRRLRELRQVGLDALGHRATGLNPRVAKIEVFLA